MALKWTRNTSDSGILRKNDVKEKKEELFVFGYSCKLFRDDEKAQHIDQGKHLIPWMGDETLKIDRYDARGALHNLSTLEAPPGGYDWRVELTRNERDVEQLCDEERYRALHTDEDEEEMYREEELKRLHAAGYGQVGFNYEAPAEPEAAAAETDEPFVAPPTLVTLLSHDVVLPETEKLNAIIEKTAKFIASQGAQMEILLRAKQADNPQFTFLNKDSPLHKYYDELISLVKAGKWPVKAKEETPVEADNHAHHENEDYLHPSLGSTVIESAPSIPSIHYRPSADCDYTLLISKMRGDVILDEVYETPPAPGDEAPPGTTPLPPRAQHAQIVTHAPQGPAPHIARAPVLYNQQTAEQQATEAYYANYAAYYQQYMEAQAQALPPPAQPPPAHPAKPVKSTGLKLMDNYNTDSDSDGSDSDTSSEGKLSPIPTPPEDIQIVIDKMAAYVARNGDEFAEIVRAKNDPRFVFLKPNNEYHKWYLRLMREKRGVGNGAEKKSKKGTALVSFSIKKQKEPDPVLPKPALPYESSSEDESEKTDKVDEPVKEPSPPVTLYKVENDIQIVKTDASIVQKPVIQDKGKEDKKEDRRDARKEDKREAKKEDRREDRREDKREEIKRPETPPKVITPREKDKEKRSFAEVAKPKSKSRSATPTERERERLYKREKHKERVKGREKRKEKKEKYKVEEVITLEESEDMIDLTGESSDTKEKVEDSEADKAKQQERRRRAAEFLKKVGVDSRAAAAAALPASSLASAMVDTLESIRKKKAEEEEKRRKREKKRHRERYGNGEPSPKKSKRRKHAEDVDADYDSSKKKKRKKDKKRSKLKKKKRRASSSSSSEDEGPQIKIDLTSTLKELRQTSPTRALETMLVDEPTPPVVDESSSDESSQVVRPERHKKKKKEDREYSEGEWSSDSDEDSDTSHGNSE